MSTANDEHTPLDPGRINVADPVEVRYWCKELKCTEAQLNEAVSRVGEHVAAVRERLEQGATGAG
jgi:hypothetical protein